MTLRLLLLRHGETDDNAAGRAQGRRDVPLNARGRAQAAAVGESLRGATLAAVVSSTASRALDVAEAIAAHHDLPVETDERLTELDQGEFDGMLIADMRERHADFLRQWRDEDPADLRMPGGETMREAQTRMVAACTELVERYDGEEVVVVSHNLALRALLCHALGVPLAAFRRFHHDLVALSVVEARLDEPWSVVSLNERCRLPAEEEA